MRRAVALVLVAVTAIAVLMGVDAVRIRGDLAVVRDEMGLVRATLADADVPGDALATAVAAAERADERAHRLHWTAARHIPLLGRSVTTVQRIATLTAAATDLVDRHVRAVAPVLDGRSLDGASLRAARIALSDVPDAAVRSAHEDLAATPEAWLPGPIAEARSDTLSAASELITVDSRLRVGLRTIPAFLGADGERRYLVLLQNSAELRGTGGLIGWWGVVTVTDGRFRLERLGRENELGEFTDRTDVTADPTFARRYAHADAVGDVHNVNVDPDLPSVAPVVLEQFRPLVGGTLDGIVAVDPFALATVLAGTRIDLPDELVPSGITDPLPSEDLPEVTTVDAYRHFRGTSPERARFLAAVAEAGFSALLDLDRDVATARRVGHAAAGRHLQLFSVHPQEQDDLVALGIAGHLGGPEGADLLSVTANNAAGNKLDVHVRHRMTGRIRLVAPADATPGCAPLQREATVRVSVDNRVVDADLDPYVIGSPGPTGDLDGPLGLNRTWFTVWAPDDTAAVAGRDGTGDPIRARVDAIREHVAVDHVLDTPMRTTRAYEIDLVGPVQAPCEGTGRRYELTWWRQAKGIPDELRIELEAPGWTFDTIQVRGGVDPAGTWGSTPPVTVTDTGPTATITGTIGSDLHVSVLLRPDTNAGP